MPPHTSEEIGCQCGPRRTLIVSIFWKQWRNSSATGSADEAYYRGYWSNKSKENKSKENPGCGARLIAMLFKPFKQRNGSNDKGHKGCDSDNVKSKGDGGKGENDNGSGNGNNGQGSGNGNNGHNDDKGDESKGSQGGELVQPPPEAQVEIEGVEAEHTALLKDGKDGWKLIHEA